MKTRHELLRSGAILTSALALGGLGAKAASAEASTSPKSARAAQACGELATGQIDFNQKRKTEGMYWMNKATEQWNGAILIKPPTKKVKGETDAVFGQPAPGHDGESGGIYTVDNIAKNSIFIDKPLIEKICGQTFLIGMDEAAKYGPQFFSVNDLVKHGAINAYAYAGKKVGPIPRNPSAFVFYKELEYVPTAHAMQWDDLIVPPQRLIPSKIVPHV